MSYNHPDPFNSRYVNRPMPGTVPNIRNFNPRDQIKLCNFHGGRDLVFPVHSVNICPKCANRGKFYPYQYIVMNSGKCDICGIQMTGAIVHVRFAWACFRCLWTKLGHRHDAMRPDGIHLV